MSRLLSLLLVALVVPACSTTASPTVDATAPIPAEKTLAPEDAEPDSDESTLDEPTERVLFVFTNQTTIEATGEDTGYFLSEAAHPWYELTEAGFTVDFMSPEGGAVEADPRSMDLDDEINQAFWNDEKVQQALQNTTASTSVDPDDYKAIFFVGGHGAMWDFPGNIPLGIIAASIWESGGSIAAVCHGPAVLIGMRLSDGQLFVEGKNLTAFTDAEEEAVELTEAMPFLLQSDLENRGAQFHAGPNFEENVVVDGQLITGQNPASAKKVGEELVEFLLKKNESSE